MSIKNKIGTITGFIGNIFNRNRRYGGYTNYNTSTSPGLATITKEVFVNFIEKYKGVRRIILGIVVWINVHIFFITVEMYRKCETVDTQWVIFAGYWAGIFGTFVAFYTMSRVREYETDTPYSGRGQWLGSNININTNTPYNVTDYTEEDDPPLYDDLDDINEDEIVDSGDI